MLFQIREISEDDYDSIVALTVLGFTHLFGDPVRCRDSHSAHIKRSIKHKTGYLVVAETKTIGFIIFDDLAQNDLDIDAMRINYIDSKIWWACHEGKKEIFLKHYQDIRDQDNKTYKVSVKYFQNEFTKATWKSNKEDVYLRSIVIAERYRNKGLGTKLIERLCSYCAKHNKRYLFVDCLINGTSHFICKKNGFIELLLNVGVHPNGEGSIFMLKALNSI